MRSHQGTQVHIFGQVYTLRSRDDGERARRVAARVDQKMNEVADRGAGADSYRIAVLAALEIADELVRAEDSADDLRSRVSEKSRRIESILDDATEASDPMALRPAAD
ncbi:MAG: cell division protein ZapA [Acidobacteria bacterium]|nr:cell division protein ZapA [Acidobacteriota bacterium]